MARKNLLPALLMLASLGSFSPAIAAPPTITIDQAKFEQLTCADQERVLYIKDRLETLTAVDRSTLTKEERKEVRTEVRALKSEADDLNRDGTVIYISTAGLIIIILLLILIF